MQQLPLEKFNSSKKPLNIEDKLQTPKIIATKNYDMFKSIAGNRKVSTHHVNDLTQIIMEVNLLSLNPMIVTKHEHLILDGQHRLQVAKNNNLTIYYIEIDKGDLRIVQMLNNINKHWTIEDFLHSFIAVDIEAYKRFYDYMQEYHITASNMLIIIKGGGSRHWKTFKRGELSFDNYAEIETYLQAYEKVRPYMESHKAYVDREFVNAYRKLLQIVSVEMFANALEKDNARIGQHVSERDYLREFESILNKDKSKNLIRLF